MLGKGNFGTVYKVLRRKDDRAFANKYIHKKLLDTEDALQSMLTEIDIMRSMKHPNICKVFDVFEGPHEVAVVLTLLNGG